MSRLEERLRHTLLHVAETTHISDDALERLAARRRRRNRGRLLAAATAATAAAAAAVALAVYVVSPSGTVQVIDPVGVGEPTREGPTRPAETEAVPTESEGDLVLAATIPVGHAPDAILATEDGVWVAMLDMILRIDPETNRITDEIEPGSFDSQAFGGGQDIVAGHGSLWVANPTSAEAEHDEGSVTREGVAGSVLRIDPQTRSVTAAVFNREAAPTSVAVDEQGVWAIAGDTIELIEPQDAQVVASVPLPAMSGGFGGLVALDDALWTTNAWEGKVVGVDPDLPARPTIVDVGPRRSGGIPLAAGEGSLWVGTDSGVLQVDPADGTLRTSIDTDAVTDLTFSDGLLWVYTEHGVLSADPGDGTARKRISLPGRNLGRITVFGGTVWVTDYVDGDVHRLDDLQAGDDAGTFGLRLEGCEPVPPRELPSGAESGSPTTVEGDHGEELVVWGEGQDEVMQVSGRDIFDRPDFNFREDRFRWDFSESWTENDPQLVEVDGHQRLVRPVGDPPISEIMISFVIDDCPYIVWIGPGFDLEEAIDYARRM